MKAAISFLCTRDLASGRAVGEFLFLQTSPQQIGRSDLIREVYSLCKHEVSSAPSTGEAPRPGSPRSAAGRGQCARGASRAASLRYVT